MSSDDEGQVGESMCVFATGGGADPAISVRVLQNWCSAQIGGVIAPGANRLCCFLAARFTGAEAKNSFWSGKTVVELGSGTGICSVLLAKLGAAPVLATDLADVLENLEDNVLANSFPAPLEAPQVQELSWGDAGHIEALLARLGGRPVDVIVAAECLYTLDTVQPFLDTAARLRAPVLFVGVPSHRDRMQAKPSPQPPEPAGTPVMADHWSGVMIRFLDEADRMGFRMLLLSLLNDPRQSPRGLSQEQLEENRMPSNFNRAVFLMLPPNAAAESNDEAKDSAEESCVSPGLHWMEPPLAALPSGGAAAVWDFVIAGGHQAASAAAAAAAAAAAQGCASTAKVQ